MRLFGLFRTKKEGAELTKDKLGLVSFFNKEDYLPLGPESPLTQQRKFRQFEKLLEEQIVNYEHLQALSWEGVPNEYRGVCWRLLLKYMPTNTEAREQSLRHKRQEYFELVRNYMDLSTLLKDSIESEVYKQIRSDVLRTLPDSTLFRNKLVQELLTRVLYLWSVRNPASGYVQGINDISAPFLIVFLNEHLPLNLDTLEDVKTLSDLKAEQWQAVEADCYWCLSKLLDGIQENYTRNWPGIKKNYERLLQLIKRVDTELIRHFEELDINFYVTFLQSANCLLLRQFSPRVGLRLYDTYLADTSNHSKFAIYLFAVIFLKYSRKLKDMSMEDIYMFLQNIPTKNWGEADLSLIVAEAFVYMSHFNAE